MRKVTIEDISRHTGLSRGTVSRALNDRPDISESTKAKVLAACRQLNYTPSHAARSLATGRNFAFAALVSDVGGDFAAGFLRGLLDKAESAGYAVHVLEVGTDWNKAAERLDRFTAERIDGVLVEAILSPEQIHKLQEQLGSRPVVGSLALPGIEADVYTPDQREAGRLTARFLFRDGRRNVIYLHVPNSPIYDDRLAGFREIATSFNIDPDHCIVAVDDPLGTDLLEFTDRFRSAEAVAAVESYLAAKAVVANALLGRAAGRDYALLGQGNGPFLRRLAPQAALVDFNAEEIGARSMEAAIQRVCKQRADSPKTTLVAPRLVV